MISRSPKIRMCLRGLAMSLVFLSLYTERQEGHGKTDSLAIRTGGKEEAGVCDVDEWDDDEPAKTG
ncbi:unnamed protein product [Clonostachys rosea]|uniref:Uncharacterized protein n=1 Tax=Bionectria ochroleuca TaxID=29856 RepID=A0ABY6UT16_BIOOC|nr:unnamed protein product [Clonostachys rosea]